MRRLLTVVAVVAAQAATGQEFAVHEAAARSLTEAAKAGMQARPAFTADGAKAPPAQGQCPSPDGLGRPWIEQDTGAVPARLAAHLSAALDRSEVTLIQLNEEMWWIGAARRGVEARPEGDGAGCSVLGTAALYVIGWGDDFEFDFDKAVDEGGEHALGARLIELRWYDETTGRKHRWFNSALAEKLQWGVDGRVPFGDASPLPLPAAPNELL